MHWQRMRFIGGCTLKRCLVCNTLCKDEELFCSVCGGTLKYSEYVTEEPDLELVRTEDMKSALKITDEVSEQNIEKAMETTDGRRTVKNKIEHVEVKAIKKGLMIFCTTAICIFVVLTIIKPGFSDSSESGSYSDEVAYNQKEPEKGAVDKDSITQFDVSIEEEKIEMEAPDEDEQPSKSSKVDTTWVKTMEIRSSDGKIYKTEFSYDSQGNCILENHYDYTGELDYWLEYKYDERRNKVQEIVFHSLQGTDATSSVKIKQTDYTYYEDGVLKSMHIESIDNSRSYHNEYDENGYEIKAYSGFDGTEYDKVTTYVNDEHGNHIRTIVDIDRYGRKSHKEIVGEYVYNTEGRVTKSVAYDVNGEISTQVNYTYDSSGNIIKEEVKEGNNGKHEKYAYEYKGGRLIKKIKYVNNVKESHIDYIYDLAKRLDSETQYNAAGEIVEKIQYKYQKILI